MLRIHQWYEGSVTVIKAEGRLGGPWVAELERILLETAGAQERVLDLEDLTHVDAEGLQALRVAITRGARLRSVSGFVSCLLKGPGGAGSSSPG